MLLVAMTALLAAPVGGASYSGGTGVESDPYQIANAEDWTAFTGATEDWDKHFVLTADIDFTDTRLEPACGTAPFDGVLDGSGRVLRNACVLSDNTRNAGLFGIVGPQGKIRDLGLESVTISGDAAVGGLAAVNCGAITSCHVFGRIQGGAYGRQVGGLVGCNEGGVITSCHSTGEVAGGIYCSQVGGLAGYNVGVITDSHTESDVSGGEGSLNIGGLIGCNDGGAVIASYSTGDVKGGWCIGGLIGANQLGTITACYATGAVKSAYNNIGGLVGLNRDAISACYATGSVEGIRYVGGLVGRNDNGAVTACFWNLETSGRDKSAGGRGLLSAQMGRVLLFQNSGWNGYPWVMREGAPPRLAWEGTQYPPIPKPEPRPGRQ